MKKTLLALLLFTALYGFGQTRSSEAVDPNDKNNNFYDNEPVLSLKPMNVEIAGEIENPGLVDFSTFYKRSIIVKETTLNEDSTDSFIGAYRYDGYSLFDLLNNRVIRKKNANVFNPIIDLYVEIENDKGEKVLFSWGEIFYPSTLHNIIIATDVMRIVPSKTKDLWPLPKESKLVVSTDLLTERNISNPVKITIRSFNMNIPVNREITPFYSDSFKFITTDHSVPEIKNKSVKSVKGIDYNIQNTITFDTNELKTIETETLHTIFYGRGKGIHSTSAFTGYPLKEVLKNHTEFNKSNIQKSLIVISGIDGYRSVYTFSEIMNRNDQADILLVPAKDEKDSGAWKIFPSCDFFSDRAVRAVKEIYITEE